MQIEQFVMAYGVEQDRVRALLPDGFESLRPVLRINSEIRDETEVYVELNAPVEHAGCRGWLNVANWRSGRDELRFTRSGRTVRIEAPFLRLSYTGVGLEGGCPAERDNCGCFFHTGDSYILRPTENIAANKEFCDCSFAWSFRSGDAHGESTRETLPAFPMDRAAVYPAAPLTAEEAASIPCDQVLGCYVVRFDR